MVAMLHSRVATELTPDELLCSIAVRPKDSQQMSCYAAFSFGHRTHTR